MPLIGYSFYDEQPRPVYVVQSSDYIQRSACNESPELEFKYQHNSIKY